ncbi:MAG: tRNA lysidine(34) synthetase TilS [Sedimentisphaerales bacterium]|nr:tRNA lysidine(34) synthetase TilS [Sedimentisphaerales bacterium]
MLEQRLAAFVCRYALIPQGCRVLVAVSGGTDSMALLEALTRLKAAGVLDIDLVCGHVNHQLRGSEADQDQQFVRQQAAARDLEFVCMFVDVKGLAERSGLSLETAGRILRLDALVKMARETGCSRIALGHQANDNAETVVHRIMRGCGFRGLSGIWPERPIEGLTLIRPLLCVTRGQILEYLIARGVAWREDSTNRDLRFTRNRIRHALLPMLQAGSASDLLQALSSLALAVYQFYLNHVLPDAQLRGSRSIKAVPGGVLLSIEDTRGVHPLVLWELLRHALTRAGCKEADLGYHHYRGLVGLIYGTVKAVALPSGLVARLDGGHVYITRQGPRPGVETAGPVGLPVPGAAQLGAVRIEASLVDSYDPRIRSAGASSVTEQIDWDSIRPPLIVRPPRPGDRFVPLGLSQEKKVARFLMDAKVPRYMRSQVMIVADQEKVIWVCPVRISESVKVRPQTRQVLALTATIRTGTETSGRSQTTA